MNILGTTPATPAPSGLPAGSPRGRAAERILAAELLSELRHLQQTTTEWTERLAGQITNHVLYVATFTMPDSGIMSWSWAVPAGCIEVSTDAHPVTVSSDGPVETAPSTGLGVYIAPANSTRVVALASRQVTLYGTADDVISVQILTAIPRPVIS